jgi:uncharacterized protein (TIGR03905 family)
LVTVYKPQGVCSREIRVELEGDKIKSIEVIGGCDGNLKGICSLLKGADASETVERLSGITCGRKPTSCPDQVSRAILAAQAGQK